MKNNKFELQYDQIQRKIFLLEVISPDLFSPIHSISSPKTTRARKTPSLVSEYKLATTTTTTSIISDTRSPFLCSC